MQPLRPLLGLLVLGAGAWLMLELFGGQPTSAQATAWTSSAQCAECHPAAYDSWQTSEHANSWTGHAVRAQSNDFANQDCIDCHAPQPVFDFALGERALGRAVRRPEGVDCIACHSLPDGGMAAGFNDPKAACRPTEKRELLSATYCASCHNLHGTVTQWEGSRWAAERVSCIDCHMPSDAAGHRSHAMPGGNDLAMLKQAVRLSAEREPDGWVLVLENIGAGHSFPSDERSRAADLFWRPLDAAADQAPWQHLHRLRSPYRHEVDLPDTLLLVHEKRRIQVLDRGAEASQRLLPNDAPGEPVSAAIEVLLIYKRSPYYPGGLATPEADPDVTVLERLELRP
jgi:Cytochrome c554 and c-prime